MAQAARRPASAAARPRASGSAGSSSAGAASSNSRPHGGGPAGGGIADQIVGAAMLPLAVARRILPDRELPVYLGVGALAAVGVLEWPFAAAAGLGYAALRRWGPLRPGPTASGPPGSRATWS